MRHLVHWMATISLRVLRMIPSPAVELPSYCGFSSLFYGRLLVAAIRACSRAGVVVRADVPIRLRQLLGRVADEIGEEDWGGIGCAKRDSHGRRAGFWVALGGADFAMPGLA